MILKENGDVKGYGKKSYLDQHVCYMAGWARARRCYMVLTANGVMSGHCCLRTAEAVNIDFLR